MTTFGCPFLGLYGSTPGSTSCTNSSKIAYVQRVSTSTSHMRKRACTHLLDDALPIHIFPLIRTTLQRSFDLGLDFLSELRNELHVHVCLQKRGADIL